MSIHMVWKRKAFSFACPIGKFDILPLIDFTISRGHEKGTCSIYSLIYPCLLYFRLNQWTIMYCIQNLLLFLYLYWQLCICLVIFCCLFLWLQLWCDLSLLMLLQLWCWLNLILLYFLSFVFLNLYLFSYFCGCKRIFMGTNLL